MRATPQGMFRDRSHDVYSEKKTNPKGQKFCILLRSKCLCGEQLSWETRERIRHSNAHLKQHALAYDKEREEGIDYLARAKAQRDAHHDGA